LCFFCQYPFAKKSPSQIAIREKMRAQLAFIQKTRDIDDIDKFTERSAQLLGVSFLQLNWPKTLQKD